MTRNKKIKILVSVMVIIALVSIIPVAYGGYKEQADKDDTEYVRNDYVDKNAIKQREITFMNKDTIISYNRTQKVEQNIMINKEGVEYGLYDIYTDDNNTEHIYLAGTDEYCGYRLDGIGLSDVNITIDENKAKEIAGQYLKTIVNNSEDYKLEETIYQEWGYYYDIGFNFYLGEIKTDQMIRLWVNTEGKIISYSNFQNKCYDGIALDSEEWKRALINANKVVKEEMNNEEYEFSPVNAEKYSYKGFEQIVGMYDITFNLKDGSEKKYSFTEYEWHEDCGITKAMETEEVIKQVRSAFTVDQSKLTKVEYHYHKGAADGVVKKSIEDSKVISEIIEVAKLDTLANSEKSQETTNSGFSLYDEEDKLVLEVNVYPEMKGYDRLLEIMPEVAEHVK